MMIRRVLNTVSAPAVVCCASTVCLQFRYQSSPGGPTAPSFLRKTFIEADAEPMTPVVQSEHDELLADHIRLTEILRGRFEAVEGSVDIMNFKEATIPQHFCDADRALLRFHVDWMTQTGAGGHQGQKANVEKCEMGRVAALKRQLRLMELWGRYVSGGSSPTSIRISAAFLNRSISVFGEKLGGPVLILILGALVYSSMSLVAYCWAKSMEPSLEAFLRTANAGDMDAVTCGDTVSRESGNVNNYYKD